MEVYNIRNLIIVSVVIIAVGIWLFWSKRYGKLRGTLAIISRLLWIFPIFLGLFPKNVSEKLPPSVEIQPIHILVDDSNSMKMQSGGEEKYAQRIQNRLMHIRDECRRLGCIPEITYLSTIDASTRSGFTPLSTVLERWFAKVDLDPWILFSDGGDSQPTKNWGEYLSHLGSKGDSKHQDYSSKRGLIVAFRQKDDFNIWLDHLETVPFSFESKSFSNSVTVMRSDSHGQQRIQLQLYVGSKALATTNAEFDDGQNQAVVSLSIPPLARGQHLVTIKALPNANEKTLWDNELNFSLEVLPNTLGILHLLGRPSWDGRFFRRYLKSEPKYDLISFFILRDPWDSQQVDERELSLIPFPVERLFNEELPNFRVIVLQNFTLRQFLLPQYQENLVKFVKEGGGLLFLGGERSLQDMDLRNSPLREILPFRLNSDNLASDSGEGFFPPFIEGEAKQKRSAFSPWYDENFKYSIRLAKPSIHQRQLATVFDDWEALEESLASFDGMQGIHHMENVEFIPKLYTPLLNAVDSSGKSIPLAVASYPGKGRAVWIFTDSIYKLALTQNEKVPRQVYNQFMQSAMTWLLRQDLNKPLVVKNFDVNIHKGIIAWKAKLRGPAARYFDMNSDEWQVSVCEQVLKQQDISITKNGLDEILLEGRFAVTDSRIERCKFDLVGKNSAFGSLHTSYISAIPKTYRDDEIFDAFNKLKKLSELTKAELIVDENGSNDSIDKWIESFTLSDGVAVPPSFKVVEENYWVLETWYIWLLLLFLPLEVIIRRWDELAVKLTFIARSF
ncbi:MAG: hypothetical protein R3B45_04805 [Bdellovibrionota bacterium]